MSDNGKYILIILLAVHLTGLIIFAASRVIDTDEGVYLSAARMTAMGKSLYDDFFYPQFALLPLVFAPLATGGWQSFWLLRGISVAAGFLSAVLLFIIALKVSKRIKAALITLGMYAVSGLILSMHSIFEAPVFAHFLSLGTFFFWLLFAEKKRLSYLILSGLFLSALINLRATFLILLPVYFFSFLFLNHVKKCRAALVFILSLLPFSLPTLAKIVTSPGPFFFNTFIFQMLRGDNSISSIITNKLTVIMRTVIDPHLLIILLLTVVSIYLILRDRKTGSFKSLLVTSEGMVLLNLVLVATMHLFPNPIIRHYVEQFIAFGLILIALNIERILSFVREAIAPSRRRVIIYGLTGLYLLSVIPYIAIFILGVRGEQERRYSISGVREVTAKMLESGHPHDTVLSEWAGFHYLSGQIPLAKTEILGFEFPLPIKHEDYMKYKLCDNIYLKEQVSNRVPNLVVTINQPPEYYADALRSGYDSIYYSETISIFKRR